MTILILRPAPILQRFTYKSNPMSGMILRKRKVSAAAGVPEEDVDDAIDVLPPAVQAKRSQATTISGPQDIGISALVLGGGSTPLPDPLISRPLNVHFNRGLTMTTLKEACDYLAAADERLAPLIAEHGLPERLLAKGPGAFATLSKSICFQQLGTKAAATIFERVLTAANCDAAGVLDPASALNTPHEVLCGAGLSRAKASYIHDLALHFHEAILSDETIDTMTADELHTALTAVKGLGPWSVDMFAMFHLGLPDCLPTGDLGVRRGMQALYGLRELPTPKQMEVVAEKWKPWRSVGSYYMWRVEVPKSIGAGKKKKAAK